MIIEYNEAFSSYLVRTTGTWDFFFFCLQATDKGDKIKLLSPKCGFCFLILPRALSREYYTSKLKNNLGYDVLLILKQCSLSGG